MINFFLLIVGFLLLVWGANSFVSGASAFAEKLGIPPLIVGLTIVAFGTSVPELAVSVTASVRGANEIVLGNVIGSNIFNLLVVAGMSSIITPLVAERDLLNRDWSFSIFSTIFLLFIMTIRGELTRLDGVILLSLFSVITVMQIKSVLKNKSEPENSKSSSISIKSAEIFMKILFGIVAIILGGQLSVYGATEIAREFNLSETVIGLTIVAVGTSLPEFITSIVATKKGENGIAIGNVIGSNLFNVLFILGISAIVNPITILQTGIIDVLLLLIISVVYLVPARKNIFGKKVGLSMVFLYVIYMVYIILR